MRTFTPPARRIRDFLMDPPRAGWTRRSFLQCLTAAAALPSLTEVPALAAELGAGRVFVKDESSRLGLPAFKVLGASWAVHQLLAGSPAGEPAATAPADGLDALRELGERAGLRPVAGVVLKDRAFLVPGHLADREHGLDVC